MRALAGKARALELKILGDAGQLQRELQKAAGQLNTFARDSKRAGKTAQAGVAGTEHAFASSGKAADSYAGKLRRVAKFAAGAFAAGAVVSQAKQAINVTEELGKSTLTLNKSFGMSVETASRWAAVAKARGADGKQLTMGFKALSTQVRQANEGSKAQVEVFRELGVSAQDLRKHGDDLDWVLGRVADGMMRMPAGTERAAISAKLFGRTWMTISPLIRGGSQELDAQLQLADKYGATLKGKTVKDIQQLIAGQRESELATLGLKVALGEALIPALTDLTQHANKFVLSIREDWPQIKDTIEGVAAPFVAVGEAIADFAKGNPEFAKTVAQTTLLALAVTKISKATGLAAVLRALSSFRPPPVSPGVPGGGRPGGGGTGTPPVVAAPGRFGRFGRAAAGRFGLLVTGAAAVGTGMAASNGDKLGAAMGGAVLGASYGGPAGALLGALGGSTIASVVQQGKLKAGDKKTLDEVYKALKVSTAEARSFKAAMSQAGGSLESIKTGKLLDLKIALGMVSFGSRDAQRKAGDLADVVNRELAGRMVTQVTGSWAAVRKSTSLSLSDINATVRRNMPRVRAAMATHSDEGRRAIETNFDGAVRAIETAMQQGRVSVHTGMSRINELLAVELKTLGVSFAWGTAAPKKAGDLPGPGAQLPKLPKPKGGSPYVLAPKKAGGGLLQIGRAGDAGRDEIPMRIAGRDILVGSGEQAAILNRHQQAELNARLADVGGLPGFFQRFNTPHYLARGGPITAPTVTGQSATAAIARGVLARAEQRANAVLDHVKSSRPEPALDAGDGVPSGLAPQVQRALKWARAHGWNGRVNSGRRSSAKQQWLWDNAGRLGLIRGVSVAKPGTSMHERGLAVDVSDWQGFKRAMESAPANSKLIWRGPSDVVHFSTTGHARGGIVMPKAIAQFARGGAVQHNATYYRNRFGRGSYRGFYLWNRYGKDGAFDRWGGDGEWPAWGRGLGTGAWTNLLADYIGGGQTGDLLQRVRIPWGEKWRRRERFAGGGLVGYARLQGLWRAAGGAKRYQALAAAVGMAESGGRPRAVNRNRDGSIDRGLWQINSVHGALSTFDELGNAHAAVKISRGGTDWSAWVAYASGAYRRHLKEGIPADLPAQVRKKVPMLGAITGKAPKKPTGYVYVNGKKTPVYGPSSKDTGFHSTVPVRQQTEGSFLKIPETVAGMGGNAAAIAQGATPGANVEGGSGTGQPPAAENNAASQLADLLVEFTRNQKLLIEIARTQPSQFANAIIEASSGGIGARVNGMSPAPAGLGVRH